jgi:hypothetical protein
MYKEDRFLPIINKTTIFAICKVYLEKVPLVITENS